MYSEENRFQKHATWNISRIEVVSKNNWRKKDPIKTVQKDFMKLTMVAKERRVFLCGRKWNPARFDDAKLGPKNVMNYPTLAVKTVLQGETLLKPIGITAKKAKSINFGPINFKSNNWAITKCSYHRIRFSLANFSAGSAAIFCLSYLKDPFIISSASKSQLSSWIKKRQMNAADDLMKSLTFLIQHDHQMP